jgi:hypothetical protein
MILRRELLRAYVTKTLAHGERYVMARRYLTDGTVEQRTNPGVPDEDYLSWSPAGRYESLEAERERLVHEGWSIEPEVTSRQSR